MTFDQFRKKVQNKIVELSSGKIFRSSEEKNKFLKISRRVCLAFWALSFLRLFSTFEAVTPLVTFTILIVLLTLSIPNERF